LCQSCVRKDWRKFQLGYQTPGRAMQLFAVPLTPIPVEADWSAIIATEIAAVDCVALYDEPLAGGNAVRLDTRGASGW